MKIAIDVIVANSAMFASPFVTGSGELSTA
jgi:hypothetical protein